MSPISNWEADVADIVPNEQAIARLLGSILLEQNAE